MRFKNRVDAGQQLAKKLNRFKNNPDAIVIGLPRGGVVPAFEIAQALNLPLDIVVPRKLGAPINPEVAMGAVTEDGSVHLDQTIISMLHVTKEELDKIIEEETTESKRRLKTYRKDRPPLDLKNKITILVDDGVATGATMFAAIESAKTRGAQKIIVAVPVGPPESMHKIKKKVDEVIVLDQPADFMAISLHYMFFPQTSDEEVIEFMEKK